MKFAITLVAVILLAGCGERASTYDDESGQYVSTDAYKERNRVDQVCQTATCWDDKSGHFISGDEWNKRRREESK